jgi:para-nitrobenzyl esterase
MTSSCPDPDRRLALMGAAALGAAAWALPRAGFTAETASPVVATTAGKVRGFASDGVQVFKGIRYGADTRGGRFRKAVVPQPWAGVVEANAYGRASPQTRAGESVSEDCLFLNVWTPGLDARRRPVMVYIHGGEYSHGSGSSPLYDGTRLARRRDVVVVTLNHRLSAFGHLYLGRLFGPEFADSGNAGIWDLVLALQWVRDNIARFGGDPGCVMLFGQSGGGAKIATLMGMPAAHGLFHRAATMSGQQITAAGPLGATGRARAYLDAVGVKPGDVAALDAVPLERLIAAIETPDPSIVKSSLYFGPVLDERGLPRHPFYPDASPVSANVPMILGNTHDETRFFLRGDKRLWALTWDELPGRLGPEMKVDIDPDYVVGEYRRFYPAYSPTEVFFAATTAARSWRGQVIEAELRAEQGSPGHVYEVDWKSPLDGGRWGAPHTIDIPLVFDNVAQPGAVCGPGPEAQAMADLMSAAFSTFARTGDPNGAAGLPAWPTYGLERRQTMIFDLPPRVADDPRGQERRLFAQVPYVQRGTF